MFSVLSNCLSLKQKIRNFVKRVTFFYNTKICCHFTVNLLVLILTEHTVQLKNHASLLPISQLLTERKKNTHDRNRNTSEALFKQLLVQFYCMQTIQYACFPARICAVDSTITVWRNNLFANLLAWSLPTIDSPPQTSNTLKAAKVFCPPPPTTIPVAMLCLRVTCHFS